MDTCTVEMAAKMERKFSRKHRKCEYSKEDRDTLKEMGTKIAGYKCFTKQFNSACQDHVKNQIYGLFQVCHIFCGPYFYSFFRP
jgi:hypothetical protein